MADIQPKNSMEDVQRFADLVDLNLDAVMVSISLNKAQPHGSVSRASSLPALAAACSLSLPLRVGDALVNYFDICGTPKRYFFEILSHFATDTLQRDRLRYFASQEGAEEMYDYSAKSRRTYIDVLADFGSARPSIECTRVFSLLFPALSVRILYSLQLENLADLLEMIPLLQPRPFSISSAQSLLPNTINVSMVVVRYKSNINRLKRGVCSTWIASLSPSTPSGDVIIPVRSSTGLLHCLRSCRLS